MTDVCRECQCDMVECSVVCVVHWVVEGILRAKGSRRCLLTARDCACAAAPVSRQQQAWDGLDCGETTQCECSE